MIDIHTLITSHTHTHTETHEHPLFVVYMLKLIFYYYYYYLGFSSLQTILAHYQTIYKFVAMNKCRCFYLKIFNKILQLKRKELRFESRTMIISIMTSIQPQIL